jgi:hypothetical protein
METFSSFRRTSSEWIYFIDAFDGIAEKLQRLLILFIRGKISTTSPRTRRFPEKSQGHCAVLNFNRLARAHPVSFGINFDFTASDDTFR